MHSAAKCISGWQRVSEESRRSWIAALEKIALLKPATVVASHKRPGAVDGIHKLYATMAYIMHSARSKRSRGVEKLYQGMIERYRHRMNSLILCEAEPKTGDHYGCVIRHVDDEEI